MTTTSAPPRWYLAGEITPREPRARVRTCGWSLLVVATLVCSPGVASSQPTHPVLSWTAELRSTSWEARTAAGYALTGLGRDSRVGARLLLTALRDPSPFVRRQAAAAAGDLDIPPARVVPALVALLRDRSDVAKQATVSLGKIGAEAAPALAARLDALLSSREPLCSAREEEAFAAIALGMTGRPGARWAAAHASSFRGGYRALPAYVMLAAEAEALPELRNLLASRSATSRRLVYDVVSLMGPKAVSILPDLMARLHIATDEELRWIAAPLGALGPQSVPTLLTALKIDNEATRATVATVLGRIATDLPHPAPIDSALVGALRDASALVRAAAVGALEDRHAIDPALLPEVAALLLDPDWSVRLTAASTLRSIAITPQTAHGLDTSPLLGRADLLPTLLATLAVSAPGVERTAREEQLVTDALISLQALGPQAVESDPGTVRTRLIALLTSRRPAASLHDVTSASLNAIGVLRIADDATVAAVAAVLDDTTYTDDGRRADRAHRTLRALGPAAVATLPRLASQFVAASDRERSSSMVTAVALGPDGVEAVLGMLAHPWAVVRRSAAAALGQAEASLRVPAALLAAAQDADSSVRWAALSSLGGIDDPPPAVLGLLAAEVRQPALAQQYAAAYSLSLRSNAGRDSLLAIAQTASASARRYALNALVVDSPPRIHEVRVLHALIANGDSLALRLASDLAFQLEARSWSHSGRRNTRPHTVSADGDAWYTAIPLLLAALPIVERQDQITIMSVLSEFDLDSTSVLPLLDVIGARDPSAMLAAFSLLRTIPGFDSSVAWPGVSAATRDTSAAVRLQAARLLVDTGADSASSPIVTTILFDEVVDAFVGSELERLDDLWETRSYCGILTSTGGGDALPAFPWPPPPYSAATVIPNPLLGSNITTLGAVERRINIALDSSGFRELGLFAIPGGFAAVTQVERFESNGRPYLGSDRWTDTKLPASSLSDYLAKLFLSKPGAFRMFALLVTPAVDLSGGTRGLSESDARGLVLSAGRVLPPEVRDRPFAGVHVHALVYHFERQPGRGSIELRPSPLAAIDHLRVAGIWDRLTR